MENKELEKSETHDVEKVDDEKLLASGGAVFECNPMYAGAPDRNFEVIDDNNGRVLGRYESLGIAKDMAGLEGQSKREIGWDEVNKLRSK